MLTLRRISMTQNGTFGVLMESGSPICVTLEDPWHDNQRNISCIPAGKYHCRPHNGNHFKDVWQLVNVPGRTAILIHAGNTTADTQGCILVGTRFSAPPMPPSIVSSRAALDLLRSYLPKEFDIEIINP